MDPDEIRELYDDSYAAGYDQRFLLEGLSRFHADFEEETLKKLLGDRGSARWLDVACGTGYFLSRFPGYTRAGMDLSPSMLALAKARNADALFFEEGDFRDPYPDWKGKWDLVSCMWFAYCYVDTVDEVELVMSNLASWTSRDGRCFVPICDSEDLMLGQKIPYEREIGVFGGPLWMNALVWSWKDEKGGRLHKDLISPHLDHMVSVMERYFHKVEVIRYPKQGRRAKVVRRKAIVAHEKRSP